MNLSRDRLLIAGAVHVDELASPAAPLIARASNPVTWSHQLGGVAANAACAAARNRSADSTITLVAAVGDDAVASELHNALTTTGVCPLFEQFPDTDTGRYSAIMDQNGELFVGLADVSLAERLDAARLRSHVIAADPTAMLVDANLSEDCLQALASLASGTSARLACLSVSPVKTQRLLPLAKHIDLLFCNRYEALAMSPHLPATASLESLADNLQELGFRQFVLTDGQSPLLSQHPAGRDSVNVPNVELAHSVNGAGDALAGATFMAWACGSAVTEAVTAVGLPEARNIVSGQRKAMPLFSSRSSTRTSTASA